MRVSGLSAPHWLTRGRAKPARRGAQARELLSQPQSREQAGEPRAEARVQPALCAASAVSMASYQQSRIQAYLEKNKIGPLFEVRRCGGRGAQTSRSPGGKGGERDRRAGGASLWLQVTATAACGPAVLEHTGLALPCLPGRRQVSAAGGLSLAGKFEPSECPALSHT